MAKHETVEWLDTLEDGTVWPNHRAVGKVFLGSGDAAGSIASAYEHLIDPNVTTKDAIKKLRMLRRSVNGRRDNHD